MQALTGVPVYVLRYWESEFKLLRPKKNTAGQRLYRRRDVDLVARIKGLLYDERLTLEGAKKRLQAEARARNRQLALDMRKADTAAVLRRVRERLEVVRRLLAP